MGLRRRLSKKWNETVNGVLSGPGVDVDSVKTDDVLLRGNGILEAGDFYNVEVGFPTGGDATVDTTSFAGYFGNSYGGATTPPASGLTRKGNLIVRASSGSDSETITVRPQLNEQGNVVTLTEIEVRISSSSKTFAESGWQEITTSVSYPVLFNSLQAKVTAGSGTLDANNCVFVVADEVE